MPRRVLIVDGHSMIFAWPDLLALHHKRMALAREELIKRLTEYQDTTDVHVVAVFDGQGVKSAAAEEPTTIQVFYSGSGSTADDVVERLAAKYAAQVDLTVATSDLLEQQTVSAFGAHTVSADGLMALLAGARANFERDSRRYRREQAD